MGLLYTKFYLDFESAQWKQISNEPVIFETIKDDVTLEINDTTQNFYRLQFKKGGKIQVLRVVGKFRLVWDDNDLIK